MNQLNRDDLRTRVDDAVKVLKRNSSVGMFIANLMMFIFFMLITWGVALSTPIFQTSLSDPHSGLAAILILPTIGWGTALLFHFITMLMDFGMMDRQFRDRAFARALREQLFEETIEKVKNQPLDHGHLGQDAQNAANDEAEQLVKLSDDGELVSVERTTHKASGQGAAH